MTIEGSQQEARASRFLVGAFTGTGRPDGWGAKLLGAGGHTQTTDVVE